MPSSSSKVKALSCRQKGFFQVYLQYILTMLGPNRANYSDFLTEYWQQKQHVKDKNYGTNNNEDNAQN